MALVTWDESYSVKVEKFDEDHRKLFAFLNKLHDAMKAGHGDQVIQGVVKEMADYTKFHFAAEEAMLQKTNYPDFPAHRAQHQIFVKKVEEIQQDLKAGKGGESIAVTTFLKDWLSNHIKQTDQKYSSHLNANGTH